MVIRPPPRIQLPEQHIIFLDESISPGGVMHGPFSGALLELLGTEVARVRCGVLDLVSAGGDYLPDPLFPKGRYRMVSSQVLEGNSNQTFVVVGPQGVAAVA
jgi:hypothetical protein